MPRSAVLGLLLGAGTAFLLGMLMTLLAGGISIWETFDGNTSVASEFIVPAKGAIAIGAGAGAVVGAVLGPRSSTARAARPDLD